MKASYKSPNKTMTDAERQYYDKISDLVHRAKTNNRYDIVELGEDFTLVKNQTQLKDRYYRLLKMEKDTPANSFDDSSENDSASQSQSQEPAQPRSSGGGEKIITHDPMLAGTPVERSYTGTQNTGGSEETIPEPKMFQNDGQHDSNAGASSMGENPQSSPQDQNQPGQPAQPVSQGQGPADQGGDQPMDGEPSAEGKERSSKLLAQVGVDLYAKHIPALFANMSKLKESKAAALQASGKIDFNIVVTVPMPQPHQATIGEYFTEVNKIADETFKMDEGFKANLTTALANWLKTKNWGTTPGELLAIMLGEHVLSMGMQAFNLNKMIKANLEGFMILTEEIKKKNGGNVTAVVGDAVDGDISANSPNNTDHFEEAEIVGKDR